MSRPGGARRNRDCQVDPDGCSVGGVPEFPPIDLARLAHAKAARELSDTARSAVTTHGDQQAEEGDFIAGALRLVHEADRVLELAVILERERGASWEAIGLTLGHITRQSAHARYAAAHREFLDALMFPVRREPGQAWGHSALPDGLDDPAQTASKLDVWAIRHREPQEPGAEQISPVSAGLSRDPLHSSETNLLGRMGAAVAGGVLPARRRCRDRVQDAAGAAGRQIPPGSRSRPDRCGDKGSPARSRERARRGALTRRRPVAGVRRRAGRACCAGRRAALRRRRRTA